MKIIIVGTAYPYRGGLAAFNECLANQFMKEGHNVEIYTFTLQYPGILFPGKTQFSNGKPPEKLLIHRKVNSINPLNWLKTGREISKKSPDLVIFCYWMSFFSPCFGYIARQISKNKKTHSIALLHNMFPHEPNFLDKFLPSYFINSMNGFIALSKSVLIDIEKIDKHNNSKVFSPHPIYEHYGNKGDKKTAILNLNLDENKEYVLFFGFIRAYKGLDLLLDAFADKRIKNMCIELIVAGEFYQNSELYFSQIEQNGIASKVHFFNQYISDDKVADFFNASSIVAQPYKSATQSGITQIAYHFEKPMLVTNVGGLPEIVPNGKVGYVVAPQAKLIADALVDFFGKRPCFSENIKREKEKYSWQKMVETILNIKFEK